MGDEMCEGSKWQLAISELAGITIKRCWPLADVREPLVDIQLPWITKTQWLEMQFICFHKSSTSTFSMELYNMQHMSLSQCLVRSDGVTRVEGNRGDKRASELILSRQLP